MKNYLLIKFRENLNILNLLCNLTYTFVYFLFPDYILTFIFSIKWTI